MGTTLTKQSGVTKPVRLGKTELTAAEQRLKDYEWIVGRWESRINRSGANDRDSFQEQTQAAARALRPLADNVADQKLLVKAAQDAKAIMEETANNKTKLGRRVHHHAGRINDRAREIFILCHTGFIETQIGRQVHQLSGESPQDAREVLRQEAREGINHGIDKYKFDQGALPLTYIHSWVRARITAAGEREGGIGGVRAKSKANDLKKKIQSAAKQLDNDGHKATAAEIARMVDAPEARVTELLPWATGQVSSLDAPVSGGDGSETTAGALLVDPENKVDEPVFDNDIQVRVRQAIDEIDSPLQQRIVEMCCGLTGNGDIEQKDLFDGVYRDKKGKAYSAEPSVISDRAKRGETVIKTKQRELNERFKNGELRFEPGTDEALILSRVGQEDFDLTAPYEGYITRDTGTPPTSGTIQEAKRKAEDLLRANPLLDGLAPRYRGDNELEYSEKARIQVRKILRYRGIIDAEAEEKLMASRAQSGGKSKLRMLAEEHGLVDKETGRLIRQAELSDEAEDMAVLMSS